MHSVSQTFSQDEPDVSVRISALRLRIRKEPGKVAPDHTLTHVNDLRTVLRGRCHPRKNGRADRPQKQSSHPSSQRLEKQRG
jgi:hypothetical protein